MALADSGAACPLDDINFSTKMILYVLLSPVSIGERPEIQSVCPANTSMAKRARLCGFVLQTAAIKAMYPETAPRGEKDRL
jgi:hypothetical protein